MFSQLDKIKANAVKTKPSIKHVTTKAQMKQSYKELCTKSKNVAVEVEPLEWSEATRLPR